MKLDKNLVNKIFSIRNFIDFGLFVAFIGILIAYLLEKYPIKEGFGLSPGTLTQSSTNPTTWNFVPIPGYYGNVTLTYQLTDGSTNPPIPETASFQVIQTYGPVVLNSPNGTMAPDVSMNAPYTFKASDLLSILGATSPQNGNMGIQNILLSASNISSSDPPPPTPIGTLTANGAAYIANTVYTPATSFVFTPSINIGNIMVTMAFQVVDNYIGQTIAPGLTQMVKPTNASISFILPYTYQAPTVIPVALSGPYYQGTPFSISNQQLIGSSTGDARHPNLSIGNVGVQPITINSKANSNQSVEAGTPVQFNFSPVGNFLTYNNGYFTVNVPGSYTVTYSIIVAYYAGPVINAYIANKAGTQFAISTYAVAPSSYISIPGFSSGGSGNGSGSVTQCATTCNNQPGCVGFSYGTSGDTTCWTKTSINSLNGSGPYNTWTSGFGQIVGLFQSGNDPNISGANSLTGTAQGCAPICNSNPNCVGYSFSQNGSDKNCYFKSSLSSNLASGGYSAGSGYDTWTNTTPQTLTGTYTITMAIGDTFSLQLSRACSIQSGSISFN